MATGVSPWVNHPRPISPAGAKDDAGLDARPSIPARSKQLQLGFPVGSVTLVVGSSAVGDIGPPQRFCD